MFAQITLPGGYKITSPLITGPGQAIPESTLGGVVSGILNIVFLIAGLLLFIFLAWGVFQYLLSQGNKEAVAKARARITYGLIGFIIIILAFAISSFIQNILPINESLQPKTINE